MFAQRAQPPGKIDILWLALLKRLHFGDLLVERLTRQLHSTLLLERNCHILVFDQFAITFGLGPAAGAHRCPRRRVLSQSQRRRVEGVDLCDLIVNLDLFLALTGLMIKLPQLVQQFYVAGIFLEQSSQREHTNFRPTGRDRGFFQGQVRLSIVRLIFQNFFDHFDRALRSPLNLTLRFHHRDRRG